jgi:hypothetical protein
MPTILALIFLVSPYILLILSAIYANALLFKISFGLMAGVFFAGLSYIRNNRSSAPNAGFGDMMLMIILAVATLAYLILWGVLSLLGYLL